MLENDQQQHLQRFQMELEFVQLLANPSYLNFLAQNGYFDQEEFVAFLQYLHYWKKPEYSKYISYPYCLAILPLLMNESFRKELARPDFANLIHRQQYLEWSSHAAASHSTLPFP